MPTVTPDNAGVHVRNTTQSASIAHGATIKEGNFVGVSVKQQTTHWDDAASAGTVIVDDEWYYLITHGVVTVADPGLSAPAKGDAVYITTSNAITKTSGGSNVPYGRIVDIAGSRGVKTGFVRINLDAKSAVAAATF